LNCIDDVATSTFQMEELALDAIPFRRNESINLALMTFSARTVQNYETADSGLISRGRTHETLTLAGAGVAEENFSLADDAWHLSVDSSKAITSPV
jgi:hypothetical protein